MGARTGGLAIFTALQRLSRKFGLFPPKEKPKPQLPERSPRVLVVLLDGTMSSVESGRETNIGLIYKLLKDLPPSERPLIYYEGGIQWETWRDMSDVVQGRGLNRQIQRAYGFLASRYRPGDRIVLMGFSRGAFAVRSLAGVIDRIGLLRQRFATERHIQVLYRHYREDPHGPAAKAFARRFCYLATGIEMVGVFDTVKALGLRLPLLWRLTEGSHAFHSEHLGNHIRHGFHALALNERRAVFTPVLWETPPGWDKARCKQVWFRGSHGDIGGQIIDCPDARGLSNIPLVWMLENMESLGIRLPDGWRDRFPCDPDAPSCGSWRGWSKLFLIRHARVVGTDPSESIHPTALQERPKRRRQDPGSTAHDGSGMGPISS